MCGFTGLVLFGDPSFDATAVVARMADRIRHRGPDDSGAWMAPRARGAMAFRRLSIQDLSAHGHQPMHSQSGRYVICFNGEVYNFPTLKKELSTSGCTFRGNSDTEVILAAVETWGLRRAIERMVGMFAMAIWDQHDDVLHLVRDRFGVKPLYYGCPGEETAMGHGDAGGRLRHTLYFGSELKALRAGWDSAPAINTHALQQLIRYQFVPAPWTLWSGIRKLLPGHVLSVRLADGRTHLERYWSAGEVLVRGARDPMEGSVDEITDELQFHIDQAVRERIVADVPLGAFLSGGIDSALVVAAMQRCTSGTTKTFTIGSHDQSIDESTAAARVAAHLGTEHRTLLVGLDEAREPIERLGELADEPLGDASFVPTYLVSKFARSEVTVVLSGDGGDEVFGGYPQHRFASRFWPIQRRVPGLIGRMLRRGSLDDSLLALRPTIARFARALPGLSRPQTQQRTAKALRALGIRDRAEFLAVWRNVSPRPEHLLVHPVPNEPALFSPDFPLAELGDVRAECWADLVGYMPDDVLLKVDRASMAVSLEAREPLLDHRLFEFAARIPERHLIREGRGKWILRKALYRSVPQQLVDTPKRGFALPVAGWIVGPLRDWAEALLDEGRLQREGHFDSTRVRAGWQHLLEPGSSPVRLPFFTLWSILAFQAWLERWN